MNEPLLTICIPNYNMGQWVVGAVESALCQRPQELIRVVVVDNASTDESREVLRRYVGIERIAIDFATEHVSMADNWNRAVAMSTTPWCLVLCADDCLLPNFGDAAIRLLRSADVPLVGFAAEMFGNEERYLGTTTDGFPRVIPPGREGASILVRSNPFSLSATMFARDAWAALGGFDAAAGALADWDLWVRMGASSGAQLAGVTAVRYYWERGATWKTLSETGAAGQVEREWLRLRRPLLHDLGVWDEALRAWCRRETTGAQYAVVRRQWRRASTHWLRVARDGIRGWRARALLEWIASVTPPFRWAARQRLIRLGVR